MTTKQEPRIAVLVVAYNASTTLEDTLERIPADFRDRITEIIVADDASDDDTFEKEQTGVTAIHTLKPLCFATSKPRLWRQSEGRLPSSD
ncbi:MAG: glycosyltransferase [Nocardioidaceae bacterium]